MWVKNKHHLLWLLIFKTVFLCSTGIVWSPCLRQSKRIQRPPARERVWFRHPSTGGVLPAMSNRHRCCRLLLLLLLLAAATATTVSSYCCCWCDYRFHMRVKPSQPRRRP